MSFEDMATITNFESTYLWKEILMKMLSTCDKSKISHVCQINIVYEKKFQKVCVYICKFCRLQNPTCIEQHLKINFWIYFECYNLTNVMSLVPKM